MCARLHTVAASNNRDHALKSLYYCLLAPLLFFAHIPFVVNHTFNATPPERLQQHPLLFTTNRTDHMFFVWRLNSVRPSHPGHSTILLRSEKPEQHVRKASHCGSKQQQRSCARLRRSHSIVACSRHIYICCCSSPTSRSWWITHSTQRHWRGCNNIPAPIARSLCEGWTRHDLHILVTAPFCWDRVTKADLLRRLRLGFNELNFNTSEQNKK